MSAATTHASDSEVTILARILGGDDAPMPDELARFILARELGEKDKARMQDLAVRNQEGRLTPAETEELLGYAKATALMSHLKMRARRTLGLAPPHTTIS